MTDTNLRILMVEDDQNLGYLLKENFSSKGYHVFLSRDGEDGWQAFKEQPYDLVLLDVMMPRRDGFSLARLIRKTNKNVPIIFLTAKSFEEDKIEGFDAGCDDYVTKPFSAKELQLRINAVMRRSAAKDQEDAAPGKAHMAIGAYRFDYDNRQLAFGDEIKRLSTKETELLYVLSRNINALISRSEILVAVWGNDDYFSSKSMDVYLTRLRKLLKADPAIEIQNVHGRGFKLVVKG